MIQTKMKIGWKENYVQRIKEAKLLLKTKVERNQMSLVISLLKAKNIHKMLHKRNWFFRQRQRNYKVYLQKLFLLFPIEKKIFFLATVVTVTAALAAIAVVAIAVIIVTVDTTGMT